MALLTPWSWASSLQNDEGMNSVVLSHPVGGTVLQQPWETSTLPALESCAEPEVGQREWVDLLPSQASAPSAV